jgi:hypothetical protein
MNSCQWKTYTDRAPHESAPFMPRIYKYDSCHVAPSSPANDDGDVHWSFAKLGPLTSRGGYDWQQRIADVFDIQDHLHSDEKDVYVTAGAIYAVDEDNAAISYPPIHLHHAHVFPYGTDECFERIIKRDGHEWTDGHAVLIQAHGDSACPESAAGNACLLKSLPRGYGYRISNYTSMFADFQTNDVRHEGSEDISYYMMVAASWTQRPLIPATFLQFQSPVMTQGGLIPSTYKFQRSKSSMLYFNFTNEDLGDGRIAMDSVILHSHETLLDAWWLFKGDGIFDALEQFREDKGLDLPVLFEKGRNSMTDMKRDVLDAIRANGGEDVEALCEVPKSSVECKRKSGHGQDEYKTMLFDRRAEIHCVEEGDVVLKQGETLTVVVFNMADEVGKTVDLLWRGNGGKKAADLNDQVLEQHTIFRADFVSDKGEHISRSRLSADEDIERGEYAPPAKWSYAFWPDGAVDRRPGGFLSTGN